jgi:hypothetical protein
VPIGGSQPYQLYWNFTYFCCSQYLICLHTIQRYKAYCDIFVATRVPTYDPDSLTSPGVNFFYVDVVELYCKKYVENSPLQSTDLYVKVEQFLTVVDVQLFRTKMKR